MYIYVLYFSCSRKETIPSVTLCREIITGSAMPKRSENCMVYKMKSTGTIATKSLSQCHIFFATHPCHSFSLMSHCGKSCIDTLCITAQMSRARTWPHQSTLQTLVWNQPWFKNIIERIRQHAGLPNQWSEFIWIHLIHETVQPRT